MANGTIAFDTLTTSDSKKTNTEKSIDTSYLLNGTCKMTFHFNHDTEVILHSFNVSSISDSETGKFDPQLTNNMSAADDYSALATSQNEAVNTDSKSYTFNHTTSNIRFVSFENNAARDHANYSGILVGDLA